MMRAGIAASLRAAGGIIVIAEANDGDQAIEAFSLHRPDICLIDLVMPGKDGLETMRAIRSLYPDARLIALTTYGGDARIVSAMKAGARAYVTKDSPPFELIEVVREVHEGRHTLPPELRKEIDFHYQQETPSPRELDVLRLASCGRSNREIASILSISETTVKSHVSNALRKLGAQDRTHAFKIAVQRGLLQL